MDELLNEEGAKEDFRLWLAAKEPDEIVGRPHHSSSCVVAKYLESRTGELWEVIPGAGSYWRINEDHRQVSLTDQLPKWASHLAFRFDSLTMEDATAKNVLTLMDYID